MLPKEFRLKINSRTLNSWKGKREIFTPLFKLVYRTVGKEDRPKIGFVVTGKAGGAVQRNKVRRLLIEAVRKNIEKFPVGIEAVFIVSKKVEKASYEESSTWINNVLPKISKTNS
jgi:ribonuclease P protein component